MIVKSAALFLRAILQPCDFWSHAQISA